jgi:hypothetical protein
MELYVDQDCNNKTLTRTFGQVIEVEKHWGGVCVGLLATKIKDKMSSSIPPWDVIRQMPSNAPLSELYDKYLIVPIFRGQLRQDISESPLFLDVFMTRSS